MHTALKEHIYKLKFLIQNTLIKFDYWLMKMIRTVPTYSRGWQIQYFNLFINQQSALSTLKNLYYAFSILLSTTCFFKQFKWHVSMSCMVLVLPYHKMSYFTLIYISYLSLCFFDLAIKRRKLKICYCFKIKFQF